MIVWGDPVMEGGWDFQRARSGFLSLAVWPHTAGLVGGDPSLGLRQRAETPSSAPVGSPDLAWRHFCHISPKVLPEGFSLLLLLIPPPPPGVMLTVRPCSLGTSSSWSGSENSGSSTCHPGAWIRAAVLVECPAAAVGGSESWSLTLPRPPAPPHLPGP